MNEALAIISAGIVIAALEIFVPGTVVIWIGIGFILAGLIALVVPMSVGAMIALGTVIGLVLMFAFRDKLLSRIQNANQVPDNMIIHAGEGMIHGEHVVFSGTEFKYEPAVAGETFREGEKVSVRRIDNNVAYVSKHEA